MQHSPIVAISAVLLGLCALPAGAAERQIVRGHVPRAIADLGLSPLGRLPETEILQLGIGLPLRNPDELDRFLKELYTPGSRQFRKYLTPQQFTERFGPKAEDYRALRDFANANGLTVVHTFASRNLLNIKASVADIERVFHVKMLRYQHPTEAREFCAPDTEPTLDLAVPVLFISGLDNYKMPRRIHGEATAAGGEGPGGGPQGGSGPHGTFLAKDILKAYLPGVSAYAGSQSIGLLEYSAFYSDIIGGYMYENGIPPYTAAGVVQNWELDGAPGVPNPSNTGAYGEVEVDIEMALAMAPGVSSVIVYELPAPTTFQGIPPDDALTLMAETDLCNQISCSWEYQVNPSTDALFRRLAAQGQAFFQASGDGGGRTGSNVWSPFDDAYITLVGGTQLTTKANGDWDSETVWSAPQAESGGGISPHYTIPWWQADVPMGSNGGSTTFRNMPDVAIVASNVYAVYGESGKHKPAKAGGYQGTSVAAPLWAGFLAVVNETALEKSKPPVGFINPIVYGIGTGSYKNHAYSSCFHDIKTGNNFNADSPTAFKAVAGYDLCTGWGTPKGKNLIDALIDP
jgi:subtilase family serine protease